MINSRIYLRQVGVSENQFNLLLTELKQEIEKKTNTNKIRKEACPVRLLLQRINCS